MGFPFGISNKSGEPLCFLDRFITCCGSDFQYTEQEQRSFSHKPAYFVMTVCADSAAVTA